MEDEIKQLLEQVLREHFPNVDFPDKFEIEITNLPEPPETPKIDLSGLEATVKQFLNQKKEVIAPTDLSKVETLLGGVITGLKEIELPPTIDHSKVLGQILEKLSKEPERFEFPQEAFFTELKRSILSIPRGGGAIGPSKVATKNVAGRVVDPAVAVKDGQTLSTIDPQATLIAGKDKDKGQYIKSIKGELQTVSPFDRNLQEQILVELKLISLKLNCLQLDELTVDDLE